MPEPIQNLFTRRTLVVAAALTLAFVGLLYAEGRPWWCKYGLGFWGGAWERCTSQHLLDPYALTHVLHGMACYWLLYSLAPTLSLRWRLIGAMVLEISWELLENSPWVIERYRQDTAALNYSGDSILNAVGDLMAAVAGFAFASQFSWRLSLAAFVVLELGLLLFIRDNLTLNLIMLISPSETLKQWQLSGLGN